MGFGAVFCLGVLDYLINGCPASEARQAGGIGRGAVGNWGIGAADCPQARPVGSQVVHGGRVLTRSTPQALAPAIKRSIQRPAENMNDNWFDAGPMVF